ncbi:MAG: Dam family site-specific DNA-(adenine-N6)-methyltransferase [Desulfococcaceae bacterium]|nr:Dam family site-specific DNA-(adenine-N6)-methyltransferase [Desulfococcaceae bacterium]
MKWAGGKGQLLRQFENYYPYELRKGGIERYIEPFIGGGAVFFEIMQRYDIRSSYISDVNRNLILTYRVIQRQPDILMEFLEQYQKEYDSTAEDKRSHLFLSMRKNFNSRQSEINYEKFSDNWIPRAAQLIFLNKTCFNGLFRLNSKGEFNVPFGKYKKPSILDSRNIMSVSKVLQNTEILISDYKNCFDSADEKTFVYFDPPYRPISRTASFTNYAGFEFTDREQIELSEFFRKLDTEKHSRLMLSNSDPKNENPDDCFFEKIYKGYRLHRVRANRMINCNADRRGQISELLITNYKHKPDPGSQFLTGTKSIR